jgi:hypothetical protein
MEQEIKNANSKKTRKDWIINIGYTILLTVAHWIMMYSYRYESMFYLYVWLLVYIFSSLLICQISWKRRNRKKRKPPKNIFTKALHFFWYPIKQDFVCLKTSLYLFFAIVLIMSQVSSLAPNIEISDTMRDFLDAMQYGFAPLIAFDQVFGQFRNDKAIVDKAYDEVD